jgi:hypothetical protein
MCVVSQFILALAEIHGNHRAAKKPHEKTWKVGRAYWQVYIAMYIMIHMLPFDKSPWIQLVEVPL